MRRLHEATANLGVRPRGQGPRVKPDALAKKSPEKLRRWPSRGLRWRQAAVKALKETGNFTTAAEAVGCSRRSIQRLREADPAFEAQVREALETYVDRLEKIVDTRAFAGVQRPVFQGGELVGHTTEYSDKLAELRLKGLRPERYRETTQQQGQGNVSFVVNIGIKTRDGDPRPPAARRPVIDVAKVGEG